MKVFSQMSQGTNCVIKTFKLSSENEYVPEYRITAADIMISNWKMLPMLLIQNIDSKNVRMSFSGLTGHKIGADQNHQQPENLFEPNLTNGCAEPAIIFH